MKQKGSKSVEYWVDYVTLPFDHIHDLDLEFSKSKFEVALSQEWEGQLIWNKRDVNWSFMTMIVTLANHGGDVWDSDRGDIRCWRVVDTCSF